MSKFTKGPWKIGKLQQIIRADRRDVAIAEVAGDFSASNEDVANARLIAAAPDLYEALEACLGELQTAYMGDEDAAEIYGVGKVIRQARAALKKASGG